MSATSGRSIALLLCLEYCYTREMCRLYMDHDLEKSLNIRKIFIRFYLRTADSSRVGGLAVFVLDFDKDVLL